MGTRGNSISLFFFPSQNLIRFQTNLNQQVFPISWFYTNLEKWVEYQMIKGGAVTDCITTNLFQEFICVYSFEEIFKIIWGKCHIKSSFAQFWQHSPRLVFNYLRFFSDCHFSSCCFQLLCLCLMYFSTVCIKMLHLKKINKDAF